MSTFPKNLTFSPFGSCSVSYRTPAAYAPATTPSSSSRARTAHKSRIRPTLPAALLQRRFFRFLALRPPRRFVMPDTAFRRRPRITHLPFSRVAHEKYPLFSGKPPFEKGGFPDPSPKTLKPGYGARHNLLSQFTIYNLQFSIYNYPLSTIHYQLSTLHSPLSTTPLRGARSPLSTARLRRARSPLSIIHHPSSIIHCAASPRLAPLIPPPLTRQGVVNVVAPLYVTVRFPSPSKV